MQCFLLLYVVNSGILFPTVFCELLCDTVCGKAEVVKMLTVF